MLKMSHRDPDVTPLCSLLSPTPTSIPRSLDSSLFVLQASHNTHLPLLRSVLVAAVSQGHQVLVLTFDVPDQWFKGLEGLRVEDYTHLVGYEPSEEPADPSVSALAALESLPPGSATLALVGLDLLPLARGYKLAKTLFTHLSVRQRSRMLIPLSLHSQLAELLIHPVALSGRLTHLLFYSPSILHHLATNFLVLPPPYTDASKFWALFTGAAHRGEGMNPREVSIQEGLVESRVRKRTLIQRALEGWKEGKEGVEACDWRDLEGMKLLLADLDPGVPQTSGTDPTQGLSFNLSLTPAQEQARGAVPLPYTHAGQPEEGTGGGQAGILYEPDEGDDVDEEDPDEDLDI